MSDSVVPLWFHFTSLFGVMLLASYLCGKRLAKTISLADAMLKAEREKALREAARTVLRVTRDSLPDAENVLPPDRFDEGVDAAYSAIEALIEKDATDG